MQDEFCGLARSEPGAHSRACRLTQVVCRSIAADPSERTGSAAQTKEETSDQLSPALRKGNAAADTVALRKAAPFAALVARATAAPCVELDRPECGDARMECADSDGAASPGKKAWVLLAGPSVPLTGSKGG